MINRNDDDELFNDIFIDANGEENAELEKRWAARVDEINRSGDEERFRSLLLAWVYRGVHDRDDVYLRLMKPLFRDAFSYLKPIDILKMINPDYEFFTFTDSGERRTETTTGEELTRDRAEFDTTAFRAIIGGAYRFFF